MITKPSKVPEIKKGKTIDSVKGLTDFMNWMMKYVYELGKDKSKNSNVVIDDSNPIKPTITAYYI